MYFRENSFFASIPPVVKNLIIINLILWLASVTLERFTLINLNDVLGMHYCAAQKFQAWQLLTYMFCHDTSSFGHVFFNMFALFMFGRVLEYNWGAKRFLIFYFVTGIGAGIVQQLFWQIEYGTLISAMNQGIVENSGQALIPFKETLLRHFPGLQSFDLRSLDAMSISVMKMNFANSLITVGASGSVFGLLLAFGMMFPYQPIYLMFIPIPIKAKYFVIGYAVIELFFGVAHFSFDNIAHFAHLGGMLFGLLLILYWRKKQFRFQ